LAAIFGVRVVEVRPIEINNVRTTSELVPPGIRYELSSLDVV